MGEHFKLTDVLESRRLCIRLRLGCIDQLVESRGSEMVRGRGLLLLVNLDPRVQQKRSGRLLTSKRRRSEPSALQAAFLDRQNEPSPGQSSVSLPLR